MSGWRTIEVGGRSWRYRFGRGNVVIRSADGKSTVVRYEDLTGRSNDVIERGQWKKTIDGMVKPGHVCGRIRKHLLPTTGGAS